MTMVTLSNTLHWTSAHTELVAAALADQSQAAMISTVDSVILCKKLWIWWSCKTTLHWVTQ